MTPEERLLFAYTRQKFLPVHQQTAVEIYRSGKIDWDTVYEIATLHGVTPLIYVNLLRSTEMGLTIPEDVIHRFKISSAQSTIAKRRRVVKLAKALAHYNEYGIDVMLVKGGALDLLVYEQPWYTVPHDIDLVIRPTKEELTEQGHENLLHHLAGNGIEYDFFAHHDIIMNGVLSIDFHQIWRDAIQVKFQGRDVFVMSPEDMLISLCINSCRKRFFRLKALCDLAETVNTLPDMNWARVVTQAKKYDVNNIVYAALMVTQMTVGCELPDNVLDDLDVHPGRAMVIEQLCRRSTLSAYTSLHTRKHLFNRNIDWQLALPYSTFRGYQIWRRLRFVWQTRANTSENW